VKKGGVWVSGIGCLCAAGTDVERATDALFGPRLLPAAPRRFESAYGGSYPAYELAPACADLLVARPSGGGPLLSRTAQMAVAAARQALADAGYEPAALRGRRVGVCVGTTVGNSTNFEDFHKASRSADPALDPVWQYLRGNPAAVLAREFGWDGPCMTVSNACAAGGDAIAQATEWLRQDVCDLALAGGADELSRITYLGFIALLITDKEPCRPFDASRAGLNLGEGAAMLLLQRPGVRGLVPRRWRGQVLGYGSASDAHHVTAPHPEGRGLRVAIREALDDADLASSDLAFVKAHGTGTVDNERVESRVLNELLPGIPYFSVKGAIGHTLGAAGAIEAALTLACLERGRIPASAGFLEASAEVAMGPQRVTCDSQRGAALAQSLAFGGSNTVLALARADYGG
jgi:3-oxoacyl-[acyl-carrier-protein] synthase-1/3-oxoacyl-[acyl-carrier-protein] synthase II